MKIIKVVDALINILSIRDINEVISIYCNEIVFVSLALKTKIIIVTIREKIKMTDHI